MPILTLHEKKNTPDAAAVLALVDVERSYIFVGCTCSFRRALEQHTRHGELFFSSWKWIL